MRLFKLVFGFIFWTISLTSQGDEHDSLKLALLTTGDLQMQTYNKFAQQFHEATGYTLELQFFSDTVFKRQLKSWLRTGEFDLLYWQAGYRLEKLVTEDKVMAIDEMLPSLFIRSQYRETALDVLTYDNRIYAIPLGQYIWGFYYNKRLFNRLDLSVPDTWEEFLQLTYRLKQQGINPLVQSTANKWPVLAWLDYLSIKSGGPAFREQLIDGKAGSYEDQQSLIEMFQHLIESDMFFAPQHPWLPDQTAGVLMREQAAMTLLAQFVEVHSAFHENKNIGFFPFPSSSTDKYQAEVAPMEVLVVPKSSKKHHLAKELLRFLIDYPHKSDISLALGWLPVTKDDVTLRSVSQRVSIASKRLSESQLLLQYFDREARSAVSKQWSVAIAKAIALKDVTPIKKLIHQLAKQQDNDRIQSLKAISPKLNNSD